MLSPRERASYGVYFGLLIVTLFLLLAALFGSWADRETARGRILENPLSGPLEAYEDE